MHKFERLEVWQLAIEYADLCYALAERLPRREDYNLASQIQRASVSIGLNIAEGSTGQSDPEQARFLGLALREAYRSSHILGAKLQAMRRTLLGGRRIGEADEEYEFDLATPFDDPADERNND